MATVTFRQAFEYAHFNCCVNTRAFYLCFLWVWVEEDWSAIERMHEIAVEKSQIVSSFFGYTSNNSWESRQRMLAAIEDVISNDSVPVEDAFQLVELQQEPIESWYRLEMM